MRRPGRRRRTAAGGGRARARRPRPPRVDLVGGEEPPEAERAAADVRPVRRWCPTTRRGPVGAVAGGARRGALVGRRDRGRCRVRWPGRPGPRRRPTVSVVGERRSRRARSALSVLLPGETMSRLLPSALICCAPGACAPWPRPTVSITAAMPIRMPSTVSVERIRCARSAPQPVRRVSARSCRPAPGTARRRRSAVVHVHDPLGARGDVVLVGDQHDRAARACSSSNRPSTSAVDVESRLPVGSSARSSAGLGDQRAGDRDPLLLAAATARRAGGRPGRRGRPGRAPPGPAPGARPVGTPA